MRVLVTGATGFVGRRLVPRLSSAGYEVVLLVEESGSKLPPVQQQVAELEPSLQTFYGDLRNRKQIQGIIGEANPDSIIHLAAVGVSNPSLDYEMAIEHNILGTNNLINAIFNDVSDKVQPRRLIVARTPGEGFRMNVYSASKAAVWSFCSMYASTRAWSIQGARIFQAYGPGQPSHTLVMAAMSAALKGEDFPMTEGTQKKDWIFVDDVADGLAAALVADLGPGESFDLGTGKLTSVSEVAEKIYRLVARGGRPLFGALSRRRGEVPIQLASVERTRELIGWQSKISLEEGLRRLLEELRG